MKVYSRDLREKVLQAYRNKEGSMMALSERFMVSLSFVFRLVKRFKHNGHINPKPPEEEGVSNGCRSCQFMVEVLKSNI